jgi:hypothetical protein
MGRGEHYKRMASECLRFAQVAASPTNRAVLVEMAQTWIKLDELARESEVELNARKARPRIGRFTI